MDDAGLMIQAGFKIDTEPFLKSTLLCLRTHLLHVSPSDIILSVTSAIAGSVEPCPLSM